MDLHKLPGMKSSAGQVVLVTLVPVVAALGFLVLATYGKRTGNIADQPSMAAFDACLTAHGLQPTGDYPTQFDATIAAQQQMKTCGDKIPKQVIQKAEDKQRAAYASYRECIHNLAGSSSSRGFGRFRGGPSSGFRQAFSICRSLLQNGGDGGAPAPRAPKTNAPGPVA
jgi:hypothetical protein